MATNMLSPPSGYSTSDLIFDDEFTEPTLNTAYWHPWLGDSSGGRWSDLNRLPSPYSGTTQGSGPGFDVMYYDSYPYGYGTNTTGNHLVGGNGTLSLIATPSNQFGGLGYSWASAAVSSYGLVSLPASGGYVQWEAKMPDSRYGAWAGLWMMSSNGAEMDIQESGNTLNGVNPNYVLASNWKGSGGWQVVQNTGMDLSANYHTYGVEYVPGQSWTVYLDGQQMARWTTGVPTNASYQLIMDVEMASGNTGGWHTVSNPSVNSGPFELDVKDVQVYSLHAGGGSSGSGSSGSGSSGGSTSPPSVPTGLTATLATTSEIDLRWTASTDPGGSVYGYDVYRNGGYIGFTPTASYADRSVQAGASYQYQVLAYNPQDQVSALSSPLTVVAGTGGNGPSVPTGLVATLATSREIDLSWNTSSDPVSPLHGYDVYRDGSYLGFTPTTSFQDRSVTGGASYNYQVLAYDEQHHVSALSSPLAVAS